MVFLYITIVLVIIFFVIIITKFTHEMEHRLSSRIIELQYDYYDEKEYYKLKRIQNFFKSIRYTVLTAFWFGVVFALAYLLNRLPN